MPFNAAKDPDSTLDYSIDWAPWLSGDTIASSAWTVGGTSITVNSSSATTTKTTVWVSGGTLGISDTTIKNTVTTTGGRIESRTIQFIFEKH